MDHGVGEVARMTGLTVRTLHHYDEIGLVVPERTEAGHRRYGAAQLERLQEVMFFRELGFDLASIRDITSDRGYDRTGALITQREMLAGRLDRLRAMLEAVDAAIESERKGTTMDAADMFEGFDPAHHEDEARERWGDTEAYQESQRRTRRYGKTEWDALKAEGNDIALRLAELMRDGADPASPEAMEAAESHRLHIDRWFYPCAPAMHAALGEMYVADPRFTATWDRYEPGLAGWVRDAFAANAADRS